MHSNITTCICKVPFFFACSTQRQVASVVLISNQVFQHGSIGYAKCLSLCMSLRQELKRPGQPAASACFAILPGLSACFAISSRLRISLSSVDPAFCRSLHRYALAPKPCTWSRHSSDPNASHDRALVASAFHVYSHFAGQWRPTKASMRQSSAVDH